MSDFNFAVPGIMELATPASDDLPLFLHLKSHRASDNRWVGINTIGPVTVNGAPMTFPAVNAWLEFFDRSNPTGPRFIISTTDEDDGTLVIEEPASDWFFTVPEQSLLLSHGMWDWEFNVEDSDGGYRTYYEGDILVRP